MNDLLNKYSISWKALSNKKLNDATGDSEEKEKWIQDQLVKSDEQKVYL